MTEPPTATDSGEPEAPRTHIIRRAPTGAIPVVTPAAARPADPAPSREPVSTPGLAEPSATVPVAAAAVSIISGWATSVVATDLIVGWWDTDRLFCLAVGFLTLVFATATVCGVILLLRRRPVGRYLIAVGAAVAALTFVSVFIAHARVPWIVYAIPALQITSGVLAMLPATKRWLLS